MAASSRERTMFLIVVLIVAGIVVSNFVVEPFFQWRTELKQQTAANRQVLGENRTLLNKKKTMELAMNEPLSNLPADPAVAESRLLHQVHQWEHDCGVNDTSFQRMQSRSERGFDLLSYHIVADGSMPQIAMLLFDLESTGGFLRVDELHLVPKHEAQEMLQLQANLTTLCRSSSSASERASETDRLSASGVQ